MHINPATQLSVNDKNKKYVTNCTLFLFVLMHAHMHAFSTLLL